jgi:hypothetical protein
MAATLPGAAQDFSREFDERLRQQFPIGTNEGALIAYLDGEGFTPDWPRRNEPYAANFVRKGLFLHRYTPCRLADGVCGQSHPGRLQASACDWGA